MSTQVIDPAGLGTSTNRTRPRGLMGYVRRNSRTKFQAARLLLVLMDTTMIGVAFLIAFNIRFILDTTSLFDPEAVVDYWLYARLTGFIMIGWIGLFVAFKLYDSSVLFGGLREYANVFNACTIGITLVIFAGFIDPFLVVARGWLILGWGLTIILVFTERFLFRRLIYALRRNGHFITPCYIVGANEEGVAIAEQLMNQPAAGINIIGFLDDNLKPGEEVLPGLMVHGPTSRAEVLAQRFGIERLIVATSGIHRENMVDLFRRFVNSEDVTMWLSSGMYEILTTGVQIQDVASIPMVSVNRFRLTGSNILAKMVLDYVGAALGLIALSPLFLIIILIMKRTDPGPIFYRRRVVGVGGKEFDAFKFRTMVINSKEVLDELLERDSSAREEWNKYFKLKNDPRITQIGAFLRKTSVDELPQLVNVLRGEMSIVGPRMITMEEVERYGKWGLNLFTVKPGITGLWQISGRSEITYEERVRLDMNYIRNYSIWLDIQIIIQTIPSVLMSKGAY